MDKCEKCGFLECRCPDHVAQNYVPKADLRKVVEGSLEEAYWEFDAMRKGDGPYKGHPQAERDAYKMSVRGIILKLLEEK